MADPERKFKVNEDKALEEAFVDADQATGEGMKKLLAEMMRVNKKTGATFFEWHKEEEKTEVDPKA